MNPMIRLLTIFLICFYFAGCNTDPEEETDDLLEELARINNQLTVLQITALTKLSNQDSVSGMEKLTQELREELAVISKQLATVEQANNQGELAELQTQLENLEKLDNQANDAGIDNLNEIENLKKIINSLKNQLAKQNNAPAAEIEKLKREIAELKKQLQEQDFPPPTQPLPNKRGFKVSQYGGSHQIWFEAEHYTARTPDTDEHWAIEKMNKAYGKTVLGPTGKFGGMLRYEFDIRTIGPKAKGGEWYMWARLVNPGNQSDFMLVEGHPGDRIPNKAPAERGPFNNTQRVFEFNVGAAPDTFGWGPPSHKEGHTKTLKNGENVTVFFRRQAGTGNKMDVIMWTDDKAYQPTDQDYEKAKALQ